MDADGDEALGSDVGERFQLGCDGTSWVAGAGLTAESLGCGRRETGARASLERSPRVRKVAPERPMRPRWHVLVALGHRVSVGEPLGNGNGMIHGYGPAGFGRLSFDRFQEFLIA